MKWDKTNRICQGAGKTLCPVLCCAYMNKDLLSHAFRISTLYRLRHMHSTLIKIKSARCFLLVLREGLRLLNTSVYESEGHFHLRQSSAMVQKALYSSSDAISHSPFSQHLSLQNFKWLFLWALIRWLSWLIYLSSKVISSKCLNKIYPFPMLAGFFPSSLSSRQDGWLFSGMDAVSMQ